MLKESMSISSNSSSPSISEKPQRSRQVDKPHPIQARRLDQLMFNSNDISESDPSSCRNEEESPSFAGNTNCPNQNQTKKIRQGMPSAYDYNQKYEESSISESKNIKSEEESTVKDKSSKDYLDVDFSISSDEETEQFNHKSMLKKSKTQYAPKENKMREYHFKRDRVESDDSVAEKFSSNKRLLPPLAKRNNLKSNFDYSDLDQAYDIEKEPKTTKAAQRKGSGLFKAKIDKNIKLQREPEEWEMPDYEKSYYVNADHFYIKKAYVVDSVCKLKGSQADYDKWKLKSMKRSLKFDAEFDKFLIFTMFKRRVFEIPTNPSMYIPSDKRIEQSMLRKNLKAYYSASTSDNQELNEDKSPKTDKNGSIYTPIEIKSHMNDRAKMILLSLDFTMVEF